MLQKDFGDQMYSIGVFAGSGAYADNSRNKKEMDPVAGDHLDIKHVVQSLKGPYYFLPISLHPSSGGEWLDEPIIVNDSFIKY